MRSEITKFLLLLALVDSISSEGYFTLTGSKLIRHKTKYHLSVTSQGYDDPPTLNILMKNSKIDAPQYDLSENITLVNGKTQMIEFDLKDQPIGEYRLHVKTLSGDFSKVISLGMNTKSHSVFVQTDKSIYKPSDKVQFRVLALDADMKPLSNGKVQVYITDGGQNRVKQFDNVAFVKGVFESALKLSDSPVLGEWKVHVELESKAVTSKAFEVAKYTLPKFELTIDANPHANFEEGKIRANINAKYTFGKIAKGNATLTATVDSWNRVKVSKLVQVDGKKPVEFDIDSELGLKNNYNEKTVKLFATFKEELTEREQNASAEVTIHVTPHKMRLHKSSEYFKPGMPFSVTSITTWHDKDVPVSDDKNPVKFTIKYYYETIRNCTKRMSVQRQYSWRTIKVDGNNKTTPAPTYETFECLETKTHEEIKNIFPSNGFAEIDLSGSNASRIDLTARYLTTQMGLNSIKSSQSESEEYIQIKLATKSPKLSEKIKIDVLATKEISQLTYQVVGSGDIIEMANVKIGNLKSFQIEFVPTVKMAPKASVVVFYMTFDGEIISDSLKVEFGNEMRNFIDIELSSDQVKPGDQMEISVKTNPNSFVGLLGVDQSVLVLKKGNDLEASAVLNELEQYDTRNLYNYYFDSDQKVFKDFEASNLFTITNAKKEFVRRDLPAYFDGIRTVYRSEVLHDYEEEAVDADGMYEYDGMYDLRIIGGSSRQYAYAPARPTGLIVGGQDRIFSGATIASGFSNQRYNSPVRPEYSLHMRTSSGSANVPTKLPEFEIRKTFPETWLFDSLQFDANVTTMKLAKKVPDTMTSWIITGFSIDPINGLGLTKHPSKFSVFQPFFVSTNLPYSIKRGEVVSIPALLFNYLNEDLEADVTLFNDEMEFEFVDVKEDDNQVKRKRSIETQRKKNIVVKSQTGASVSFMIRPLKVGHIRIKVVATSTVAGDGVERQLIVEPEGVTQFMNKAIFIDLRNESEFKSKISIEIPSDAVPDSTKIEASAMGDVLGSSIDNLDQLIKLPSGCGEQNMLNFVPNIVVLDYLTAVGKLTPEIESKAKTFMETGYQKQQTYKHNDGSYSAFGKSDRSGSTWLTAYVAKSFRQASKYITVNEDIIQHALSFLAKVQTVNGSFPEVGYMLDKKMQGGSSNGIALTAYVLITFLENQSEGTYQGTIEKALKYVLMNLDGIDDEYALAIATYAVQLAKHSSKDDLLEKLNSKAVNDESMKHWEKPLPESSTSNYWRSKPNSVNVEMSAYALQAFVEAGRDSEALPIMKWLVAQRNANGGFQSTQDTVVGLQALSKIAAKAYVTNSSVDISITHSSGSSTNIQVNDQNALVLQKFELPATARDFEVSASGQGVSILQLSYKYNTIAKSEWPRFTLEHEVHPSSNKDFLHLIVCTSFVADGIDDKSNMAVMELSFPSGFTFDSDTLPELKSTVNVKKIETKESETIVVVYFDDIGEKKICPEFKAYRTHGVAKQKPAAIKVYDYYDTSRRASSFYNAPEVSLCDICNGAAECKLDCEEPEVIIV